MQVMEEGIREEFYKYKKDGSWCGGNSIDYRLFEGGYKAAMQSAQEEIDRLRSLLKEVNTWTDLTPDPECNCIYHKIQREVESWEDPSLSNPESKV